MSAAESTSPEFSLIVTLDDAAHGRKISVEAPLSFTKKPVHDCFIL